MKTFPQFIQKAENDTKEALNFLLNDDNLKINADDSLEVTNFFSKCREQNMELTDFIEAYRSKYGKIIDMHEEYQKVRALYTIKKIALFFLWLTIISIIVTFIAFIII